MIKVLLGIVGFVFVASFLGLCKAGKKGGICKYDGQE